MISYLTADSGGCSCDHVPDDAAALRHAKHDAPPLQRCLVLTRICHLFVVQCAPSVSSCPRGQLRWAACMQADATATCVMPRSAN